MFLEHCYSCFSSVSTAVSRAFLQLFLEHCYSCFSSVSTAVLERFYSCFSSVATAVSRAFLQLFLERFCSCFSSVSAASHAFGRPLSLVECLASRPLSLVECAPVATRACKHTRTCTPARKRARTEPASNMRAHDLPPVLLQLLASSVACRVRILTFGDARAWNPYQV